MKKDTTSERAIYSPKDDLRRQNEILNKRHLNLNQLVKDHFRVVEKEE